MYARLLLTNCPLSLPDFVHNQLYNIISVKLPKIKFYKYLFCCFQILIYWTKYTAMLMSTLLHLSVLNVQETNKSMPFMAFMHPYIHISFLPPQVLQSKEFEMWTKYNTSLMTAKLFTSHQNEEWYCWAITGTKMSCSLIA